MSRRGQRLAWPLVALAFAFVLGAAVVRLAVGRPLAEVIDDVVGVGLVFATCLPVLGAIVARRRDTHAVGWLMLGIGVAIAFHNGTVQWSETALVDEPGSLPGGDVASWLSSWAWLPGWLLTLTVLPAVFPDGRPAGRQRRLAWCSGITIAVVTVALAAASWDLRGVLLLEGESAADDPRLNTLEAIYFAGLVVLAPLVVGSIASLLVRYRRAASELRHQIAWVVYGIGVAVLMSVVGSIVDAPVQVLEELALVGGLAVAMLRHRLYDIDVVINRTLVYGALTATLAAAYLASVLILQLLLNGFTGDSGLAIAAATLAVAALIRPARNRIQHAVDRRFFRRKYDAQRTLASFTAHLRDEVALDTLTAELRTVVADTMQPAHVSLWLKEAER